MWGVGFCFLRLAAAASLVSVSAASNSTAHKTSTTADGKVVPFYRCFINSSSLQNRNLNYTLHSSSTTKPIDVGLFNLGGFRLADEEVPDKAGLHEVLRVLDVLLRRLSDGERLPLAFVKLVRQCVAGQDDAVSSPAGNADGAQQSAADTCTSRSAETTIAVQRSPRSSVR